MEKDIEKRKLKLVDAIIQVRNNKNKFNKVVDSIVKEADPSLINLLALREGGRLSNDDVTKLGLALIESPETKAVDLYNFIKETDNYGIAKLFAKNLASIKGDVTTKLDFALCCLEKGFAESSEEESVLANAIYFAKGKADNIAYACYIMAQNCRNFSVKINLARRVAQTKNKEICEMFVANVKGLKENEIKLLQNVIDDGALV